MNVRIFGLKFEISDKEIKLCDGPTDLKLDVLQGRKSKVGSEICAAFEMTGQLGATSFDIYFPHMHFQPSAATPGLLVPAREPLIDQEDIRFRVYQGPAPPSSWCLIAGGLHFVGRIPRKPIRTINERLLVRFTGTRLFRPRNGNEVPLVLFGGNGGFILDLSAGNLTGTENAISALASVEVVHDPPQSGSDRLMSWRGRSRQTTPTNIRQPPATSTVVFAGASLGTSFVLNADTVFSKPASKGNPVLAPLSVTGADAQITLRHVTGGNPRLEDVCLLPVGGRGITLTVYAYSDATNKPSQWFLRENLPLAIRAFSITRPGAFVVSPQMKDIPIFPADASSLETTGLHGIIGRSRFLMAGQATMKAAEIGPKPKQAENVNPELMADTVLPRIEYGGTTAKFLAVRTSRPGETFASTNGRAAANFLMKGDILTLPMIDRRHVSKDRHAHWDNEVDRIEMGMRQSQTRLHNVSANHESALHEPVRANPDSQRFGQLFTSAKRQRPSIPPAALARCDDRPPPQITNYRTKYNYGNLNLEVLVQSESLDYMVVPVASAEESFDVAEITDFTFDPSGNFVSSGGLPRGVLNGLPAAIIKLTRTYTLQEIFEREEFDSEYTILGGTDHRINIFDELLPKVVKERAWTGVILFNVPIVGGSTNKDAGGLAGALTGNTIGDDLSLAYLAVSPKTVRHEQPGQSYFARVIWENNEEVLGRSTFSDNDGIHDPQNRDESRFQLRRIDATWSDGKVENMRIDTILYIDSLFGIRHETASGNTESQHIAINGRYDEDKNQIYFLAAFKNPLRIFPFDDNDPKFGPFRKITLSSVEIVRSWNKGAGKPRLAITLDGDFELRKFNAPGLNFDGFELGSNASVEFRGLDLYLPSFDSGLDLKGNFLKFNYPSLRFNLDVTPFQIGPIGLKLNAISMSWDGKGIDWEAPIKLFKSTGFDINLPTFFIDLRIDFGALPELALKSIDKFFLDLQIAFQGNGGSFWHRIQIGLTAIEFRKFELDLMRFLSLSAKKITLESKTADRPNGDKFRYSVFFADRVKLLILGKTIVDNLTITLFMSPNGKVGFLAYIPSEFGGFLKIRWVLIGRDIFIKSDLADEIMSVDILSNEKDACIGKKLVAQSRDAGFLPLGQDEQSMDEWVFAAGFGFGELLDGRFLFQDRKYYGLALGGGIFRDWFGFDFALSVLYEKGPTPNQDRVVISIRAPKVDLPAFAFLGGVVSLRISFDNSFLLDCGFPWRSGAQRLWNRSFGAIVTPFQGSGGFYIRRENVIVPVSGDMVALGGGYAFQGGLGASYGGGVFSVWVTIGLYVVINGVVVLRGDSLQAFRMTGAIGVLLRGGGELNFWIISVRVEITVSAEASLILIYRSNDNVPNLPAIGIPASLASGRPVVRVDFLLYARASARACIGSGWFKICKSISVSVPMRARYDLQL